MDASGAPWDKRHIEALCNFRGDAIHLNADRELLIPENLQLLRKYSLGLNNVQELDDEYATTFEGWEGEFLQLDGVSISPSVAASIVASGIDQLSILNTTCSLEVLGALCQGGLNCFDVSIPRMDIEAAKLVAGFEGEELIVTRSRMVTRAAAEELKDSSCSVALFCEDNSIYADEETIGILKAFDGLGDVETFVNEEELEWHDRCRLVLDIETAADEEFYEHSQYPRVADEVLEFFVSQSCEFDLDGVLVLGPGQAQILSKIEDEDRFINLGVFELTDDEAQILAGIERTGLHFSNLDSLSDAAIAAFSKRRGSTTFENTNLREKFEEFEERQFEEDQAEYESSAAYDVAFNLGRLRQRIYSKSSVMGDLENLLEVIEADIKEKGFPVKDAQLEAWIGHFLLLCANGEDTSEAKQQICGQF